MELKELGRGDYLRILGAVMLIFLWIAVPIYIERTYNFSAVKASFGIVVIYYIVYRVWKWREESATV